MMKMNSKKTSVYEALNLFFYYYLKKRDIEKTLSMVTDDIYSLGTGNGEIALNKIQFRDLITSEINALPISIDYRILNYREKERAKLAAGKEARERFSQCPICRRLVCDSCFLICEEIDLCRECAERMKECGEPVAP